MEIVVWFWLFTGGWAAVLLRRHTSKRLNISKLMFRRFETSRGLVIRRLTDITSWHAPWLHIKTPFFSHILFMATVRICIYHRHFMVRWGATCYDCSGWQNGEWFSGKSCAVIDSHDKRQGWQSQQPTPFLSNHCNSLGNVKWNSLVPSLVMLQWQSSRFEVPKLSQQNTPLIYIFFCFLVIKHCLTPLYNY